MMTPDSRSLTNFLSNSDTLTVLSGAGVSTASGIPDYRDRNGERKHAEPTQYGDYVRSESARKRYWARSYIGWQRFSAARPNAAHRALANLEAAGKVDTLITQNVDRLHHDAGSDHVIELHGDLSKVRCVGCGAIVARSDYQHRLAYANRGWRSDVLRYKPDGDADLDEHGYTHFVVPGCAECEGIVKPDVVMFGEGVPKPRVERARAAVERADALLVVGSSLMVFSGFRFARQAAESGKPIAIVNQGRTRADDIATLKVDADCAQVLTESVFALRRNGRRVRSGRS